MISDVDRALRPLTLADFTGQDKITSRLRIATGAAKDRHEPIEHCILNGPPGLGKTTLSHIIANEMGAPITATAAPAIQDIGGAARILLGMRFGHILFIDEIHRLNREIEEFLYSAMEDFAITLPGRPINIRIAPFTLIGATTAAHLLTAPMRMRFGLDLSLDFYEPAGLARIATVSAAKLGLSIDRDAITLLSERSRGTPRVINRLLRRARDYAHSCGVSRITAGTANGAMDSEGIDRLGLTDLDRIVLRTIAVNYAGGPVGINALASTLDRDPNTLGETVEPFLLRAGLIVRTGRGRCITELGRNHIAEAAEVAKAEAWL